MLPLSSVLLPLSSALLLRSSVLVVSARSAAAAAAAAAAPQPRKNTPVSAPRAWNGGNASSVLFKRASFTFKVHAFVYQLDFSSLDFVQSSTFT